jgi:hypothetical protein
MLQHYLWSVDPQRLVRPFETLGTATSRRTLRDFRNRNISSDPSRLWEPQRLVRPYETLGTATSRPTLRDSGNHRISSDPAATLGSTTSRHTLRDFRNRNVSLEPSRLWEPQRLVRPFETLGTATSRQTLRDSGNRTPYRPKRGLGDVLSIEKDSGRRDRSLFVRDLAKEQ